MELLSDFLEIPQGAITPCMTHQTVFTDSALDPDPKIWTTLDPDEQFEVAEGKREAQDRAVALCSGCPVLSECQEWAQRAEVFGVVGGQRQSQRPGNKPDIIDRYIETGAYPHADILVKTWVAKGKELDWIASRLDIPLSEAEKLREGKLELKREAARQRSRKVNPVLLEAVELLADRPMNREDLIKALLPHVPMDTALRNIPPRKGSNPTARTPEEERRSGATRWLRGLLRTAIRDGKLSHSGSGEATQITLAPKGTALLEDVG